MTPIDTGFASVAYLAAGFTGQGTTSLEPVFWALLVILAVCWGALLVMSGVLRSRAKVATRSGGQHVHCFPLDRRLDRKCLICGVSA